MAALSEGAVAGEDDLLAAARRGDRKAFEKLVEQTYKDTYTLALRLCGNPEDAGEVVQEAYLRAWRGIERFRGDSRFSTWMYRITANCATNLLSRRNRDRREQLDEEAPLPDRTGRFDPERGIDGVALREDIVTALRALPYGLRAVVVLRDIYDLPHEAIAKELGISEAAAKVRLHRARNRLREMLFGGETVQEQGGSGDVRPQS
ncbi:MAG: RNA polymerase subunit sigma-24 [Acidimicrobiales bacterium]|nr:MAG: RNA polymerase subunit sigma-24 [Acidimicrobiales bacterium]